MTTVGPLPSDIQPVENETRDRIITGLVTIIPFVAVGVAGWQVWGSALNWSDVFLFLGLYFFTGVGITVGFHRLLTHRSFKTYPWLRGLFGILGSAAIEGPVISWAADHRHHAFPTSATHGLRWWQLDVSSLVINGLEKAGLAWDVVRVSPERVAAKAAG